MTFPDPLTVRLRWSKPNNLFLSDQASAYPTIIYRPAHYLKQFHKAFNSRGCAEEARARRGAPQLGGAPQQEGLRCT